MGKGNVWYGSLSDIPMFSPNGLWKEGLQGFGSNLDGEEVSRSDEKLWKAAEDR